MCERDSGTLLLLLFFFYHERNQVRKMIYFFNVFILVLTNCFYVLLSQASIFKKDF